jgi:integrase
MAKVTTRNNKLYIDFRYKGVRCKEKTKFEDTPANRKTLEGIVKKLEACITLDTLNYAEFFPKSKKVQYFSDLEQRKSICMDATPLFKQFSETWYQEKEVEWKYAQQLKIKDVLKRHLNPVFGGMPVSSIKKSDLLEFRASLGKVKQRNNKVGLSPARINLIMTPLRMILNEAADRYEFVTPFRNIKPVKVPKTDVNPFTLEEVWQFINHVRPDYRDYYKVRFFTGLRTSEIHGLPWKNVDFERKEIVVDQALVNKRIETTKTMGSNRVIQMNSIVLEALISQKQVTGKHTFVFATGLGNPLDYNNISKRVWFPTLKRLGFEKRRPYETRHTAATLWLASGEAPEWIARQMGHSTTKMLFQVYSRYVPNLTRQDGSRFEALIEQKLTNRKESDYE